MLENLKKMFKKDSEASMDPKIEALIENIGKLPNDWHGAGTMDETIIRVIYKYASQLDLDYTVETGSGISTLFFSNISKAHKVFTVDTGNGSLQNVLESPLYSKDNVEIIEGPTQLTMPKFNFEKKIKLALIDGPHGYPFPDLEYFYIYPQLDTGAILIVDDIHIKTINNMFHFIKADDMFELLEIDRKKTAIFRRTDADTFPPTIDGWWMQKYNKDLLTEIE